MKPKTSPIYLVLPVIPMDDPIIHTDGSPFCDDMHCPCHCDKQEPAPEPACPEGYYWNGRQALRANGWPTLGLAEREGW